jgi:UDP-sulfoquinovose synthase
MFHDKTVFVAGGDGFCGWPISLRLSNLGANVIILDNLSRRKIDIEMGTKSLTPIKSIYERIEIWNSISKNKICFELIDIDKEYEKLCNLVQEHKPNVIIQLAEQRSAPYSMKDNKTRRYTVNNNVNSTHNLLNSVVDIDRNIHFIHMGTMGVYGYGAVPNCIIPEGYVNVKMPDKTGNYKDLEILHPAYPGSVYHMTKTLDALVFQFYAKNYKLKISDLHQGIIWGLHTKETQMHSDLVNRFDYDSDYGTVLNRFIMQSANNIPLTVYGTGEQTRAFIHIKNSVDCIVLAVKNSPKNGDRVLIRNQMTETHKLNYLVEILKENFPKTNVEYIDNPRNELVKNDLEVKNTKFLDLGLEPIYLNSDSLKEIYNMVKNNKGRIDMKHILPKSFW